jgi:hypothetical protein
LSVYWVTWRDESNALQARASALVWGPSPDNFRPPVVPGLFNAGPFQTRSAAEDYKNAIGTGAIVPPPGTPVVGNVHVPNPLTGINAVGDFFSRLTEAQTWTRVGEVLLGGILVYAGVRALSHGSPTVGANARKTATRPVTKAAKAAASVAVPEARVAGRTLAKKAAPKTTKRVAAHREHVRKYGQKRPYSPPEVKPPRKTIRESHIYHHKTGKP